MSSRDLEVDTLKELLSADHEKIRQLLDEFLKHMHAGNWEGADAVFGDFERLVNRHLVFEEQHVFPVFDSYPDVMHGEHASTTEMRKQHHEVRSALADVGVDLELHQLREVSMQQLAAAIERHSAKEDAWAQALLQHVDQDGPARESILDRLSALITVLRDTVSGGRS